MYRKYSKIKNVGSKDIDFSTLHLDNLHFVVTEKIHGANYMFCLEPDGTFHQGSRSYRLNKDSSFFGHIDVINRYEATFIEACNTLYKGKEVGLYGELFGGSKEGRKPVQREVYYSPELEFAAFDLMVDGEYLSYDELETFANLAGIPLVPLIARNISYKEALSIPNTFDSLWSDRSNNVAEGIVISPVITTYDHKGGRVILKNKADKFLEVVKKAKVPKSVKELSDDLKAIVEDITRYITLNRLSNICSHLEPELVVIENFNNLRLLFIKDIMEDYKKDNPDVTVHRLNDKPLSSAISTIACKLIHQYLKEV